MLLSVIIPVYGQWQLTKNCLKSLKQYTPLPIEVILVDNGAYVLPEDKTREEAQLFGKELFGNNFIYLPQEKNINFAGACNLGAKTATSPFIFFLNNDTLVEPNYFLPLLSAIENATQPTVVAPLLLYPESNGMKKTIQHIGVYFTPPMQAFHLYEHFPYDHRIVNRKRKLQCMTGAALLMTKELFFAAGAFDTGYINGFEDVELMGRLKKLGTELILVPESRILHLCSQSIGRHNANKENSMRFFASSAYKAFVPDYHIFLEQDGYDLHFNAYMQFEPRLNRNLEKSLEKHIVNNDIAAIEEHYLKEPFWYKGLESILKFYQKDIDKRIFYLLHSLKFSSSIDACFELTQLCLKKKDWSTAEILLDNYTKLVARFDRRKEDLINLQPKFRECSYLLDIDARELIAQHENFMSTTYLALQNKYQELKTKTEHLKLALTSS